jgi:dihydrofolate reductase
VRNLILKMAMSIDGFVSDLDGTNRWMFGADQEAKAWGVQTISQAGLHIMGSRSFLVMGNYWPTSTDQFAPPMNRIPKAVFSRQGPAVLQRLNAQAGNWAEAYAARGDLAEEIARLKAQDGGPIMAHGGASFARSLVARGLVDEFILTIAPVALGQGLPLFADLARPASFRLASSKAFPGGAVTQTYLPA